MRKISKIFEGASAQSFFHCSSVSFFKPETVQLLHKPRKACFHSDFKCINKQNKLIYKYISIKYYSYLISLLFIFAFSLSTCFFFYFIFFIYYILEYFTFIFIGTRHFPCKMTAASQTAHHSTLTRSKHFLTGVYMFECLLPVTVSFIFLTQ